MKRFKIDQVTERSPEKDWRAESYQDERTAKTESYELRIAEELQV
jgi:hypothetical protein